MSPIPPSSVDLVVFQEHATAVAAVESAAETSITSPTFPRMAAEDVPRQGAASCAAEITPVPFPLALSIALNFLKVTVRVLFC